MPQSTYIAGANFTNFIGQIKEFPYNLFDTYNGAIYTPWDKATLFKDVAMTMPVTAVGDLVQVISDVSGRGNHLFAIPVSTGVTGPGTYVEVGGKGRVATDGTQGYQLQGQGLSIFSAVGYALSALAISAPTLVANKNLFRANVTAGNTPLFEIDVDASITLLRMRAKRLHADTLLQNSYTNQAGVQMLTHDLRWAAGDFSTFVNGAGEQTKSFAAAGVLPAGAANGIYLANYATTARLATMQFAGGVILAGASALTSQRANLEAWIRERTGN